MKASALEFRLRYWIHALIFGLGFWAPWNYFLPANPIGANAHLWGVFAAQMGKNGIMNFTAAFNALLTLAMVFAFTAAALRTWGTAYLGVGVVESGQMHTGTAADLSGVNTNGPYRHLRNPLYLGTFLHTLALTLLMSWSGAVFTVILMALVQIRLILGEEAFLKAKLGAPYAAYCEKVSRLLPSLKPRIPAGGARAQWVPALLGEIYFWAVALSFAFAGWYYDAGLLIQCVLVSFGLSLVVRAVTSGVKPPTPKDASLTTAA